MWFIKAKKLQLTQPTLGYFPNYHFLVFKKHNYDIIFNSRCVVLPDWKYYHNISGILGSLKIGKTST